MKIAKHFFTVQPFKVFEGLLKPRDIHSRKEKYNRELEKKFPSNILPTDVIAKDILKEFEKLKLPRENENVIRVSYIIDDMTIMYPVTLVGGNGHMTSEYIFEITLNKDNTAKISMFVDFDDAGLLTGDTDAIIQIVKRHEISKVAQDYIDEIIENHAKFRQKRNR